MNPFDTPPSGSPVSMSAPEGDAGRPSRGRLALVAVLTAGLIGGGIAGISQLASADEPSLAATVPDETVPPADDTTDDGASDDPSEPAVQGEIVIDVGDGEPVVIDIGEIGGGLDELHECLGLPDFDIGVGAWEPGEGPFGRFDELFGDELLEGLPQLGELDGGFGSFEVFGGDGSVTVAGPDGVSVVDLGENGSVTVTKDGDDISIDTTGDATVQELDDLIGDFGAIFDGEFGDDLERRVDELFEGLDEGAFDEFLEGLPAFDELSEIAPLDAEQIEDCLAELRRE